MSYDKYRYVIVATKHKTYHNLALTIIIDFKSYNKTCKNSHCQETKIWFASPIDT